MRRVVVSGGAGFIGSALCRYLTTDRDTEVVVIDKLTYAATHSSLKTAEATGRLRLVVADICDHEAMKEVIASARPEQVYHLAAETHVDRSISSPEAFLATNVSGTFSLLQAARRYWDALAGEARERFRFVHVSTDEVFGSLGAAGAFTEASPYDPSSPYSATKAASDHIAKAWHRTYGLPVIISNCSNNYGPFQFPEKLIPLMILNALEGRELPVYGDGQNIRDWLFVDDHARGLVRIAEAGRPGESYLVGGRSERTNLQIVEVICDAIDRLSPGNLSRRELIRFVADRPGHDFRYAIDPSRMTERTGWSPSESLESGLEKTVRWYLDNSDWWQPLRNKVYGGERIGLKAN